MARETPSRSELDPYTLMPSQDMSETEMISILQRKYDIKPKLTPSRTHPRDLTFASLIDPPIGVPPHRTTLFSNPSPVLNPVPPHPGHPATMYPYPPPAHDPRPPKIPLFSGELPTPKSEISFYEWQHEVKCIRRDPSLSQYALLQAIRGSLRGTARRLMVSLGEMASVGTILEKLEVNFGEPARQAVSMGEFFRLSQNPGESVTEFGCRLESSMEQAFAGNTLDEYKKAELLCERLWSGLLSDALKSNTRHRLDYALGFDNFMRDIRQVEKELGLYSPAKAGKQAVIQAQQVVQDDVTVRIRELEERMESRYTGLQSGIDKRFAAMMQRLDTLSVQPADPNPTYSPNSYEGNSNRGRGRGWRGRGDWRNQNSNTGNPNA